MRGELTFLSWNLAMFEPSAQAPLSWEVFDGEAAIRDLVLDVGPDVVVYQELPAMVPFVETHEMAKANPRTHNGNLATLMTHELAAEEPLVTVVDGCAVLVTFSAHELTLANVHLAPGPGAADERLVQVAAVVAASPTDRLLVVGDTNTRVAEAEVLVELGLVSTRPPRPTWDSRRNRFREGGAEFVSYFTRWFASPGVEVTNVRVHDRPLDRLGHRFHLSDHYPLSGTVVF